MALYLGVCFSCSFHFVGIGQTTGFKTISEMTYSMSGGAIGPTHLLYQGRITVIGTVCAKNFSLFPTLCVF